MGQQEIELAREVLAAFARRDMETIEGLCHPDAEFDWSRRLIDPTVFHGYAGLRKFFEEANMIFDEIVFEEEEVIDVDDQILIVSKGHFRGRASGIEVSSRAAQVWTFRDGKVARFRFYQGKDDALADLARERETSSTG